jgi:hypothetical protein
MEKLMTIALVLLAGACPCAGQRYIVADSNASAPAGPARPYAVLDSFARVPSGPSTRYTVELLVAIPDTAHPRALFTWPRVRLGHVFLGLSKTNDTNHAVLYLGFYARSPVLAFTTGLPVRSRLADNHGHPYSAGLRLRLTEGAWDTLLTRIRADAGRRYSVLGYNCVHYALDVVNSVRRKPLHPPLARFAGQKTGGYLTPNGVYILLCSMRSGPEGKDIVVRHGQAQPGEDWLLRADTAAAPGGGRGVGASAGRAALPGRRE